MEIKLRLRELRKRAGLSQEALAELVDSSQAHIGNIERGVNLPNTPMLCRLACALGCKLSDIAQKEDD